MSESVSQYLYISTAPSLSREDVEAVLASSVQNNPSRGITGLLLYNGRNFLQLLEGEEAELVDLMLRITRDPRHSGMVILERRRDMERAFPDWAMKRVLVAESIDERRKELEAELPANLDPQIRKVVSNFAMLN